MEGACNHRQRQVRRRVSETRSQPVLSPLSAKSHHIFGATLLYATISMLGGLVWSSRPTPGDVAQSGERLFCKEDGCRFKSCLLHRPESLMVGVATLPSDGFQVADPKARGNSKCGDQARNW